MRFLIKEFLDEFPDSGGRVLLTKLAVDDVQIEPNFPLVLLALVYWCLRHGQTGQLPHF